MTDVGSIASMRGLGRPFKKLLKKLSRRKRSQRKKATVEWNVDAGVCEPEEPCIGMTMVFYDRIDEEGELSPNRYDKGMDATDSPQPAECCDDKVEDNSLGSNLKPIDYDTQSSSSCSKVSSNSSTEANTTEESLSETTFSRTTEDMGAKTIDSSAKDTSAVSTSGSSDTSTSGCLEDDSAGSSEVASTGSSEVSSLTENSFAMESVKESKRSVVERIEPIRCESLLASSFCPNENRVLLSPIDEETTLDQPKKGFCVHLWGTCTDMAVKITLVGSKSGKLMMKISVNGTAQTARVIGLVVTMLCKFVVRVLTSKMFSKVVEELFGIILWLFCWMFYSILSVVVIPIAQDDTTEEDVGSQRQQQQLPIKEIYISTDSFSVVHADDFDEMSENTSLVDDATASLTNAIQTQNAIILQSTFRRHMACQSYQNVQRSIVMLQSVVRMWLVSRAFRPLLEMMIEEAIQERELLARQLEKERISAAAVILQSVARMYITRQEFLPLLEDRRIQANMKSVVLAQSIARRWIVCRVMRPIVLMLVEEVQKEKLHGKNLGDEDKKVAERTTFLIRTVARSWLARGATSKESTFGTANESPAKIHKMIRQWIITSEALRKQNNRISGKVTETKHANVDNNASKEQEARMNSLVVLLQSQYRGWMARRMYASRIQSIVLLQSLARRWLVLQNELHASETPITSEESDKTEPSLCSSSDSCGSTSISSPNHPPLDAEFEDNISTGQESETNAIEPMLFDWSPSLIESRELQYMRDGPESALSARERKRQSIISKWNRFADMETDGLFVSPRYTTKSGKRRSQFSPN